MFQSRFACFLAALVLVFGVSVGAAAAEVDCDDVYCFTQEDFPSTETLTGICVTSLPDSGTVYLGSRVIRPGDILTAEQLEALTFDPLLTETDLEAVLTYLPVYETRVDQEAVTTIAVRGKTDKTPVAEDSSLETYKNLANDGRLKASDPEGQPLTYSVVRQPKRGTVEIHEDGTFTYTPKKNKVGVDSFTYTATDPAGNVSRTATVTVRILKPSDTQQYSDTTGTACTFAAEWMRNTGIFSGEQVGDTLCFFPEKTVSRGEFLAMVMNALEIPAEEDSVSTGFVDEAPDWLKPYLAAAMRRGLVTGYPQEEGAVFAPDQPITGAEAAVILKNALELPVPASVVDSDLPAWAANALSAVQDGGIDLSSSETVTRAQAANAIYQAVQANA